MTKKNGYTRRSACRLCESVHLQIIADFGSVPIGDEFISSDKLDISQISYPLELNLCRDCGMVQIGGIVDPQHIYGKYLYETSNSLGLVEHFKQYAQSVLNHIKPDAGSLVVDIGSNDGTLLKFFKNRGMAVLGIEPAKALAEKMTQSGVESLPHFFSNELARDIRKTKGPASIITANNVFANVENLDDFIEGVKELLAPDGVFIFETGYMIDLIQNTVLDNIYHEHLSYFSIKPLERFFNLRNFEIIHVDRVHTKGGSIRVVAQEIGGSRPKDTSVKELISLETELGFDRTAPFKAFVNRIEENKDQINKMLAGLKNAGNKICAYGASVGATTLLYYLELGNMIECIFDDNPIKFNTYSPGHNLRVLDSKSIYDIKPDYVILLAWRYFEPIKRRHQKYLSAGGHFILPFPMVETI